jgi:hypothetical protein
MTTIEIRPWRGGRGTAVGLGISLLAHMLILAWLQNPHASRTDAIAEPQRMEFVLVTPPPAALPRTVTAPPQASAPAKRAAAQRKTVSAAPTPVITSAAPTAPPAEPAPTSATAASPSFDIAAARQIAREDDIGPGSPVKRKPLVNRTAERHAEAFERARRVDCQTARAGSVNLLANVVLLAKDIVANAVDDSGCKW